MYRILMKEPLGKQGPRRLTIRLKDNIKMKLREVGCEDVN